MGDERGGLRWKRVKEEENAAVGRARAECAISADEPSSALCLSGGGIRSATFCLGVLQGLARGRLLHRFDYLSTVSGGGYIGAWLDALIQKERVVAGRKGRVNSLVGPGCLRAALDEVGEKLIRSGEQEADEVRHLREFSNFLTPRVGPFSLDTWTLGALYVRNLLLNWLVLFPLLAMVLMPLLAVGGFHGTDPGSLGSMALVGAGLVLGGLAVLYGVVDLGGRALNDSGRDGGAFLACRLAPFLLGAIAASIGWRWLARHDSGHGDWIWWVVIFGGVHAVAWFVASLCFPCGTWSQCAGRVGAALASGAVTGLLLWAAAEWIATIESPCLWSDEKLRAALWATCCPSIILLGICAGSATFAALSSGSFRDEDREWMGRSDAFLLLAATVWAGAGLLALVIPASVDHIAATLPLVWGTVAGGGLGSGIAAAAFGNSPNTSAEGDRRAGVFRRWLPSLAAVGFLACVAVALSVLLGRWMESLGEWAGLLPGLKVAPHLVGWCVLAGLLGVWLWVAGRFINVNKFSLHCAYRDRLVRAYLAPANPDRAAHPFTDFCDDDKVRMHWLRVAGTAGAANDILVQRPFHVINVTMNLAASEERLAWQQRKAAPFTISPLHCGSAALGLHAEGAYRDTLRFGGPARPEAAKPGRGEESGISLGTAMALSGAAVSPNMGFYSSGLLSAILTLFNLRLGSWLGNPSREDRSRKPEIWERSGPEFAAGALLRELLGRTTRDGPYVSLSDGGHFENLGLFEMVRRRCRRILVVDVAEDPDASFKDLGNALRKIRIDQGVEIGVAGLEARFKAGARGTRAAGHWASAEFHYPDENKEEVPPARLLYLRPNLTGDEPGDILNYARETGGAFPFQSTGDQWFDETQFESYRALGEHSVAMAMKEGGNLFGAFWGGLEGAGDRA